MGQEIRINVKKIKTQTKSMNSTVIYFYALYLVAS